MICRKYCYLISPNRGPARAFAGTKLEQLTQLGDPKLTRIGIEAFKGTKLRKLGDMSGLGKMATAHLKARNSGNSGTC